MSFLGLPKEIQSYILKLSLFRTWEESVQRVSFGRQFTANCLVCRSFRDCGVNFLKTEIISIGRYFDFTRNFWYMSPNDYEFADGDMCLSQYQSCIVIAESLLRNPFRGIYFAIDFIPTTFNEPIAWFVMSSCVMGDRPFLLLDYINFLTCPRVQLLVEVVNHFKPLQSYWPLSHRPGTYMLRKNFVKNLLKEKQRHHTVFDFAQAIRNVSHLHKIDIHIIHQTIVYPPEGVCIYNIGLDGFNYSKSTFLKVLESFEKLIEDNMDPHLCDDYKQVLNLAEDEDQEKRELYYEFFIMRENNYDVPKFTIDSDLCEMRSVYHQYKLNAPKLKLHH